MLSANLWALCVGVAPSPKLMVFCVGGSMFLYFQNPVVFGCVFHFLSSSVYSRIPLHFLHLKRIGFGG